MANAEVQVRHAVLKGGTVSLLPKGLIDDALGGLMSVIYKVADNQAPSNASDLVNHDVCPPYDFRKAKLLRTVNAHHAACLQNKTSSTVMLGLEGEDANGLTKVERELDPFCDISFIDTLGQGTDDFWEVGTGYLEIVREAKTAGKPNAAQDEIVGIHWLEAERILVHVYDKNTNSWIYKIQGSLSTTNQKGFARFGHAEEAAEKKVLFMDADEKRYSEIIELKQPTNRSRYYGHANWLAALASIDLVSAIHQFSYDFFINRGVPEFMIFVKGQILTDKEWKKIEDALKDNVGLGNSHKSFALNIGKKDVEIQVEKLGLDGYNGEGKGEFEKKESATADIVSAHQTPPLLAGIQIPGKLGASNELPNAIRAYQALVIGPGQRAIRRILGNTLGNPACNGQLTLRRSDFAFKTLIDEIDLQTMDTSTRMREPEGDTNRDLSEGVRE